MLAISVIRYLCSNWRHNTGINTTSTLSSDKPEISIFSPFFTPTVLHNPECFASIDAKSNEENLFLCNRNNTQQLQITERKIERERKREGGGVEGEAKQFLLWCCPYYAEVRTRFEYIVIPIQPPLFLCIHYHYHRMVERRFGTESRISNSMLVKLHPRQSLSCINGD
mmetsp:Transcript_18640/g.30266  ORF Transcript_18640/g.30266 Transcript_18640/m.30266 type:complete len:168 (-) Transcript_18640:934-1437(-)